jgi:hypothetical protein
MHCLHRLNRAIARVGEQQASSFEKLIKCYRGECSQMAVARLMDSPAMLSAAKHLKSHLRVMR